MKCVGVSATAPRTRQKAASENQRLLPGSRSAIQNTRTPPVGWHSAILCRNQGDFTPLVASSRITPRFSKIRPKADNSGVGGYCSRLLKIVVLQLWPQSQGAIARSIPGNDKRVGVSIPKGGGQAHVVASPEEMVTAPGANPKTKSTFCWGTMH